MLVLTLMQLARDPRRWEWLWNFEPQPSPVRAGAANEAGVGSLPERRATGDADSAAREPEAHPARPAQAAFQPDWGLVRDDRPFHRPERELLRALLAAGRGLAWPNLAADPPAATSYAQLIRQPESLRGKLLAIRGTARRARALPFDSATSAELPIDYSAPQTYYEIWLTLAEGPEEPVVVYLPSLPAGFPLADTITAEVDCEAVYFKRWPYEAGDGLRLAPVLVAARLRWSPGPPTPAGAAVSPRGLGWPIWFTVAAGLLLAAAAATRRRLRQRVPGHSARGRGLRTGNARAASTAVGPAPWPSDEELAVGLARLAREGDEPRPHPSPMQPEDQP